ncbi:unnamed protein product [Echinostoma caproni]|uniref:NR LBD domain-containing protein n=1 Tax=Echinostoma caproni TaxID=27848 RepID=A0A183AFS4_9TREM|nr:unnamed protein product [Echinostoma caproni]
MRIHTCGLTKTHFQPVLFLLAVLYYPDTSSALKTLMEKYADLVNQAQSLLYNTASDIEMDRFMFEMAGNALVTYGEDLVDIRESIIANELFIVHSNKAQP